MNTSWHCTLTEASTHELQSELDMRFDIYVWLRAGLQGHPMDNIYSIQMQDENHLKCILSRSILHSYSLGMEL